MTGWVEVHVEIDGQTVRAGTLYAHARRGAESATFTYTPEFVAAEDAYALEPALALDLAQHQTRNDQSLFGALTDCAPDRWGRRLLRRAEQLRARAAGTEPRQLSEIDVLLGGRDDLRQGALRFRTEPQGPFVSDGDLGVPALTELNELMSLADQAERGDANYEELKKLIRVASSLGGARPKAHVRTADGRVAIAKFPSSNVDTWNVPAWEKVAFDLARDAGIRVPTSQLLTVDGRFVHVVERFDRSGNTRIGYASAKTMLEANDGEDHSYLEIADAITAHSANATADLHELWRRIAFSVLICNTDDHLRNHAFLHVHSGQWALSPAFDLNPNPEQPQPELSLAIDEADPTASIDNVRRVAPYFGAEGRQGQQILEEVARAVAQWRAVATANGLDSRDIDEMEPAFRATELESALRPPS